MKYILITISLLLLISCNNTPHSKEITKEVKSDITTKTLTPEVHLTENLAYTISQLPIACINTEYPNKTGQLLQSENQLGTPSQLHPAFYGCFDWHSSVHGHWSIVSVLNKYPNIKNRDTLIRILKDHITPEKIQGELEYFNREGEYAYERTYGWAWLLELSGALKRSKINEVAILQNTLKPLTKCIADRYINFLPKQQYPTRVGTHTNTAFGLSLAYDYAKIADNDTLLKVIEETAIRFFKNDVDCPISWEPGGSDFLSPCLEEANLMRKILDKDAFRVWLDAFLPQLKDKNFTLPTGIVSDRTDGHLIHLDGLNYSRAWCLFGIANTLGNDYTHLNTIADKHIQKALENLSGDSYEGSHWLGTFALYALLTKDH
ncbi:hypothetical protein NBRC110019_00530 [Neptunitalea chrysea]|uniref:DUF2891 domain-containing protein n=1 Tax=Neptunitalea chrysea TaxID=1647581 RepID=A0A9W6B494_9FLAO|nr:DUF2891 domain-containing protein [Neptunitalea chrysea]GLB51014.1 hypothetical protein NBRC110019_00530 [Neptunitalea chrysea]